MLSIIFMYHSLVGSERFCSGPLLSDSQESLHNMSSVVSNSTTPLETFSLETEKTESLPGLSDDICLRADDEGNDSIHDVESSLMEHASEPTCYLDVKNSISKDVGLFSNLVEQDEDEEDEIKSDQDEKTNDEEAVSSRKEIVHYYGPQTDPEVCDDTSDCVSVDDKDTYLFGGKDGQLKNDKHLSEGNDERESSYLEKNAGITKESSDQVISNVIDDPESLHHEENKGKTKETSDQYISEVNDEPESSRHKEDAGQTLGENASPETDRLAAPSVQDVNIKPVKTKDKKSSQGMLASLAKSRSPEKYQSSTLGRQVRKARRVPGPVAPHKQERGDRSKTEPPPELAPPDILQVSWVWETRSPTRTASIRRRPSRRVSCRRRFRPRLTPRRSSGSLSSGSPNRRFSPPNCFVLEENEIYFPRLCDGESNCGSPPHPPDVLNCNRRNSSSTGVVPFCDTDTVNNPVTPQTEVPEACLRQKRAADYFQSASKAIKQRWRNSEILLPRFINETLENMKNNDEEHLRKKDLLEKAKELPIQLRRLSYLLFKHGKHADNLDVFVKNKDGSGESFCDFNISLASRLRKRRKSMRRTNNVGIKRQSSFSPGNSLKRNNSINWSQKYQTVMMGGRKRGSDSCGGPIIRVTEADKDEAFVSEDDNISTTGSILSHLKPQQQQKKGSVLDRLISRIRPRSLSTSRSFTSSRSSMSGGSEDGHSPSHSSDYEDQDDAERSGSASLVGRMRGLRRDMQKKISRLKSPRGSTSSSPGPLNPNDKSGSGHPLSAHQQPAASSYESLPTAAPVASTTALGSNRSSLSGEEAEPYTGPFIGRARALVDCQPSPYDRDALKFKKGDIIDIIAKNPSGLWKGCVDGRVGHFKFILVEEEVERPARRSRPWRGTTPRRGRACTLEELLTRLHLGHLIQVFVLNGYEDLEQFRDIEKADLDCLGITDPETCAKILTAVALLHDADSEPEQDLPETLETTEVVLRRGDHGRDSGCYTDHRTTAVALDENNLDTRQSTPSTDTSSGYHSRGAYNIPLGETTLTSKDDHSSAIDSPSSESAPAGIAAPSTTHSEPHSYRAHLATVLPASPRAKLRHNQQCDGKQKQDSQVDYEAKYVTARSVFEKEVVKREVPVTIRSPKRSTGSQSPTEELENGGKTDSGVAVAEADEPLP